MHGRLPLYLVITISALLISACAPQATQAPVAPAQPVLGSVAILVIDDFMIEATQDISSEDLAKIREEKTGSDNCAYTLDGQQVYNSRGAQVYNSRGATSGDRAFLEGIPHGKLVYAELFGLINQNFTFDQQPSPPLPWLRRMDFWKTSDGYDIALVAVDTDNYATEVVRDRLQEAILRLNTDFGIQRFVLNMSFVILPCDLGSEKDTKTLYDEYLSLLSNTPAIISLSDDLEGLISFDENTGSFIDPATGDSISEEYVRNTLLYDPLFGPVRLHATYPSNIDSFQSSPYYQSLVSDPISAWLEEFSKDPNHLVISVAAAGNESINFSFAPGIWKSVVSVSAEGEAEGLAPYSNWGEVKMDGTTYYNGNPVYGTSFAAPVLSFLEAIYLYNGGDIDCTATDAPPLGYATISGAWDNLSVSDASSLHCTPFIDISVGGITSTSPPPTCFNDWEFVADVTVPDNTHFAAGTPFTKTWQLRNTGTCSWDSMYNLIFITGEQMGGPSSVPIPITVPPGDTVEISVPLIAPMVDGTYRGDWQIAASDGTSFGAQPYVQIIVP